MNSKIFKYIKWLLYVLMAGGVAVFIYMVVVSATSSNMSAELPAYSDGAVKGTNVMLLYTYILVAVAILAAVIFPLINIVKNPKGGMRSLIGIAAMVVVLGGTYLLASDTPIITAVDTFDNPLSLKLSDMGLYSAYIMLAVAFVAIIFGELKNAFKK